MIKVAVVGGTGYSGVELLRILVKHPEVSLQVVTSRSDAGKAVSDMYPNLRGYLDLEFSAPDIDSLKSCDLVFFATPNGVAMQSATALLDAGVKVIDLAADFRFKDIQTWQNWYGMEHACPDVLAKAVYGLPEFNRSELQKAQIIGSAGCYTSAVQLSIMPLLETDWVDASNVIVDAKSGVSGAGRALNTSSLHAERSENFSAYGVSGHRHHPEIVESLSRYCKKDLGLTFVPHLVPMVRGIFATCYLQLEEQVSLDKIQKLYEQRYREEAFVDILPAQSQPETRDVKGSNFCRIALHKPGDGNTVVVLGVIDNLVKGASGQAVQNMNIMFGFDESLGLETLALSP